MTLPRQTAARSLRPVAGGLRGEAATDPRLFAGILPTDTLMPQSCGCGGQGTCACGKASPSSPSYIYAIGRIRAAFPSLSVEKEFYQAADSLMPLNDSLLFDTLSRSENLYIAREMCWILQKGAGNIDYFIINPRSYNELTGLIEAIYQRADVTFDLIIGLRGPTAPADACNGLQLPLVVCNEAWDFTDQEIISAILSRVGSKPTPTEEEVKQAKDIFYEIIKLTNNTGDTDDFRAINFLATRYLGIYITTYWLKYPPSNPVKPESQVLSRVITQPAPVQGTRKVLNVIFTYHGSTSNVMQQWYCSVDVTGQFPSLITPMTRYYAYF